MTRRKLLLMPGVVPLLRQAGASESQNLSYPLASFEGAITPADRFFVQGSSTKLFNESGKETFIVAIRRMLAVMAKFGKRTRNSSALRAEAE